MLYISDDFYQNTSSLIYLNFIILKQTEDADTKTLRETFYSCANISKE